MYELADREPPRFDDKKIIPNRVQFSNKLSYPFNDKGGSNAPPVC